MNGDRVRETIADLLSRNWWLLAIRGVAAIIFGVLAFIWPGITLLGLIYLFGFYAIIHGILSFVAASNAPKGYPRFGSLIFSGILGIAAGLVAFFMPGLTTLALLILIAVWAIVGGIAEISTAIRLRKVIHNEWWLIVAGILSLAFGIVLLIWPGAGALALVWWIASFAIVFGALLVGFAFEMRHRATTLATPPPAPA